MSAIDLRAAVTSHANVDGRLVNAPTCFYEEGPTLSLTRRVLLEGIGTLPLMFVITAAAPNTEIDRIAGAIANRGDPVE